MGKLISMHGDEDGSRVSKRLNVRTLNFFYVYGRSLFLRTLRVVRRRAAKTSSHPNCAVQRSRRGGSWFHCSTASFWTKQHGESRDDGKRRKAMVKGAITGVYRASRTTIDESKTSRPGNNQGTGHAFGSWRRLGEEFQ